MADGTEGGLVPRIISCSHPDYPHAKQDFIELWTGALDTKHGKDRMWNGGFRGRPDLADALWSSLRKAVAGKKPPSLLGHLSALREFWRFLDSYERRGFAAIDRLEDVRPELAVLWLSPIEGAWEPPKHKRTHNSVGALVREARRELLGQSDVWDWHPFPRPEPTDTKGLPTEAEIREALNLLKDSARTIFARWARADDLASSGRSLLDEPRKTGRNGAFDFDPTEADAHATYRALIQRTGDPLPSIYDLNKALGLKGKGIPVWWPKHPAGHPRAGKTILLDEVIEGLYPTYEDLDCLSQLFAARSGWNMSTVLSLDIGNPNWAQRHGDTGTDLWRIESFKDRSNAWQWTIAQGKLTTGCYRIVAELVRRTAPLRALVEREPNRTTATAIAMRSPWIAAGTSFRSYQVLVREATQSSAAAMHWKKLIRKHNANAPSHRPRIPETMTPSDWRDIYASRIFEDSRYSWVLVQWALGHKHMRSTRHYLRSRLWRRHSEQKLSNLITILVEGIEVNARLDATVIRATLEYGHTPTVSDIARLDAHRRVIYERELSYTGHMCTSPFKPPPEIDPGNPGDGSQRCRRGDRCPSCPQGQAIDSWHMSKRVAELKWLAQQVNEVVWRESHYAVDLESLEAELTQWAADEVNTQIAHWHCEIEAGRHKVLRFGSKQ